ncbi:MAG: Lrp/AsnC family transcriptional regulator [Candidatus Nezhaarchaeota archaeon]|nr:Lrp/AsnC family transcriptional regulator [Candidatus Nezhaarchaeota archaeon]MCX8141502.1 Lrp/AsnC family transcriptional regulator [Candidatus Nezhaarchaeota archaeon]MDW8049769.1 Lrp/AsnC family transcriptional regulator [Nitrososphaerota archaeon]
MQQLDDIDHMIINLLIKDSRTPYTEIANKVGLSEAGVRKRINRLLRLGIIKRFTVEVDFVARVRAITLITVDPSTDTSEVSRKVREAGGVERVYEVTGLYDVVALISSPSMAEVNRCIDELRRVKGVKSTNTMIVLREW